MLGIGGLSAGFGDFDLVAGIDPSTVDEMGGAGGKFDERIGLGDQFAGKRIGFPGYFGPDFLVAVAGRDGVGRFSEDTHRRICRPDLDLCWRTNPNEKK